MMRRVVTLLLLVVSIVWTEPARVNAADPVGWQPVFSESFDDSTALPAGCSAYDGAPDGAVASYYRPEAVTVSGGYLKLALRRGAYGGKQFVTGQLRCLGAGQLYGRYEFKARAPLGAGIESVAMLRPVDVLAQGHESKLEIVAKPGDEKVYVSNGAGGEPTVRTVPGTYSGWHTYVIEWAPSGFRAFIDNRERTVDADVSTQPRWIGFAVTVGDPRAGELTPGTTLPAEFEIDYLRIWSFEPVSSGPAVAATPSTVDKAMTPVPVDRHWSVWLAAAAILAAAVAVLTLVVRRARPRRRSSGHRA